MKEMIGELSEMSLDQMMDALDALDAPTSEAEATESRPDTPVRRYAIREIYGSRRKPESWVEDEPQWDMSDDVDPDSFLSFRPETNPSDEVDSDQLPEHDFSADEVLPGDVHHDDAAEGPSISGIVKDEIVLALLQVELVTMAQVFDAIRLRTEGVELWRVLADHPELDSLAIRSAVAEQRGYTFQEHIDVLPDESFIGELATRMQGADLARLVGAGLLPIPDPSAENEGTLVVLSADPTTSRVQSALVGAPLALECRMSTEETVEGPLKQVREWLSGMDIDASSFEDPDHEALSSTPVPGAASERRRRRKKDRAARASFDRVVKQLVAEGVVDGATVDTATQELESSGESTALWRIVADMPGVDREAVYEAAARVYAFKIETIEPGRPDQDFVRLTMETLAEEHHEELLEKLLVPFEHTIDFETGSGRIVFVTPDPTSPDINRLVHELDLGRFELRYASESAIVRFYDELFPRKNEYLERITEETDPFDLGTSYDDEDALDEDALEAEISRSKLINLFEASLVEATRQGVSDIHMFPNPNKQVEIHFRLDGRLKKWHTEEKVHPEAFLAVVKDNSSNVDRFERDSAQDGFIQREIDGALIRFRVSILPIATANQELKAESIVIRILDDRKVLTDITKLGMLDTALDAFNKAIRQPHGMVILTGPTGSGKSTTLVAALYQVVGPEVNVLTVEDPVEYIIKGVRQIKLSHKLDLEGALRAILRHDPDIVMVGEMRDKDTAELAIKLANTGHLTFSTLHTNDAPAAVSRLYKMGVEPFLIAYAINLVVAQRLIRVVCQECKVVDDDVDRVQMRALGWTDEEIDEGTFYKPNNDKSCPKCGGNGYKGRRAVCETLYFSRDIRNMIAESGEAIDEDAIRDKAVEEGMLTLADSARVLVNMGETTVAEMVRMTASH